MATDDDSSIVNRNREAFKRNPNVNAKWRPDDRVETVNLTGFISSGGRGMAKWYFSGYVLGLLFAHPPATRGFSQSQTSLAKQFRTLLQSTAYASPTVLGFSEESQEGRIRHGFGEY